MDFTLEKFKPIKQFGLFTADDYCGNKMPGGMGVEILVIDKEKLKQEIEAVTV
jgi:hypothetical protein